MGWAIAGGTILTAGSIAGITYLKSKPFREAVDAVLPAINEACVEGGLEPFQNAWDLLKSLKAEASDRCTEEDEGIAEARARGAIAS